MADIAAPVATSTPAPAAPAPTTTAKPALDLGLGTAPAAAETPAAAPKDSSEYVRSVAKAQAAERKAMSQLKELQSKLDASSTATTEAQKAAEAMAEIKKNPRRFTELTGISLEDILNAIAAPDEPVDPAHLKTQAELKALQDRIDAREKADKDAKDKAEKDARESVNARAIKVTADMIAAEGVTVDAEGYPRWAIVSQDPAAAKTALDAVLSHVEKHSLEISQEEGMDMLRQALDQMEAHERKKLSPILKAAAGKSLTPVDPRAHQPNNRPRAELPANKWSSLGSGSELPPPSIKEDDRPKTRPSRF